MDTTIISIVLMISIIMLLYCYTKKNKCQTAYEKFSVSNKPMGHDGNMSMRGPWYNVDYITPSFHKN